MADLVALVTTNPAGLTDETTTGRNRRLQAMQKALIAGVWSKRRSGGRRQATKGEALRLMVVFLAIPAVVWFCILISFVPSSASTYREGRCTIVSAQARQHDAIFGPSFTISIQYTAPHDTLREGDFYRLSQTLSGDEAQIRSFVARYQAGGVHPCWYPPASPLEAVLERQVNYDPWGVSVLLGCVGLGILPFWLLPAYKLWVVIAAARGGSHEKG